MTNPLAARRLVEPVGTQEVDMSGVMSVDTTFEPHYRVGTLATMWGVGRETVRLLVKDEPGVIKIRLGRKRGKTTYSVPASVAARIHTKLLHPPTPRP